MTPVFDFDNPKIQLSNLVSHATSVTKKAVVDDFDLDRFDFLIDEIPYEEFNYEILDQGTTFDDEDPNFDFFRDVFKDLFIEETK